jgi:hypothetical protein
MLCAAMLRSILAPCCTIVLCSIYLLLCGKPCSGNRNLLYITWPANPNPEAAMPSVALQFPSGRGTGRSGISRRAQDLVRNITELLTAIAEARDIARHYYELSRLSDADLRKHGLTRDNIARFVLLGRRA